MKRYFALLSLFILVLTAGCIGVETFDSSPPIVDQEALNNTGFEETDREEFQINESRELFGAERGAEITSHMVTYQQPIASTDLEVESEDIEDIEDDELLEMAGLEKQDLIDSSDIANESDNLTEEEVDSLLESDEFDMEDVLQQTELTEDDLVDREDILENLDNDEITDVNDNNISEDTPGAMYNVVSTPSAGVLGTELNPLVQTPNERIVEFADSQFEGDIEIGDRTDTYTLEGEDGAFTVEEYEIKIETETGQEIEGELLLSVRSVNGDVLLMAGAYPEIVVTGQDNINELMLATSTGENS